MCSITIPQYVLVFSHLALCRNSSEGTWRMLSFDSFAAEKTRYAKQVIILESLFSMCLFYLAACQLVATVSTLLDSDTEEEQYVKDYLQYKVWCMPLYLDQMHACV